MVIKSVEEHTVFLNNASMTYMYYYVLIPKVGERTAIFRLIVLKFQGIF